MSGIAGISGAGSANGSDGISRCSSGALIEGAVATFECFNRSRHEEGDHIIFVGEVERCSHRDQADPLLYHGGAFYTSGLRE